MDPNLNNLLKWSLANSSTTPQTTTNNDPTTTTTPPLTTDLPLPTTNEPPLPTPSAPRLSPNAAALASLLSGPSDATLMRAHLATLTTPTTSTNPLPTKLLALAGLEQLLESIDNVNALSGLGLWPALVALLGGAEEAEMRRGAAACVGTAVQNNAGAQGCLVEQKSIPTLVRLAVEDADEGVRRKAIYALSSAMRNHQPATDEAVQALPGGFVAAAGAGGGRGVEAGDMEAIDGIMAKLREGAGQRQTS